MEILKIIGVISSIIALFGSIVRLLLKRQLSERKIKKSGDKGSFEKEENYAEPIGRGLTGEHTYKLLNKIIIVATVIAVIAVVAIVLSEFDVVEIGIFKKTILK